MKKYIVLIVLAFLGCGKKECMDPVVLINGSELEGDTYPITYDGNIEITATIPDSKLDKPQAYEWSLLDTVLYQKSIIVNVSEPVEVNLKISNGSCTATKTFYLGGNPGGGDTNPIVSCSDSYEYNNSFSNAADIDIDTPIGSMIGISGDVDYFKVYTDASKPNIKVRLLNLPSDYDVQVYRTTPGGGIGVGSSINSGNADEFVYYNYSSAASYVIQVKGKNSSNYHWANCYTLVVESSADNFCVDYNEPNNSISEAASISSSGYSETGAIGSSNEKDYYEFYCSGNFVNASLTNLPADYNLTLLNASGNVLASSTNGGINTETISVSVTPGNYYYLLVEGATAADRSDKSCYQLQCTTSTICYTNYEPYNSMSNAYPIAVASSYNAAITDPNDVDWYSVYTSNKTTLSVYLSSLPANYNFGVYNSSGVLVTSSTSTGTTTEFKYFNVSSYSYYYIKIYPASASDYSNTCYYLSTN